MLPWFLASKNKKKPVDTFYSELCSALNSAGIPLAKANNPTFKAFLEKYCKRPIPDTDTLLKFYFKGMRI
uniref:Uncharacterized protein n=2 Tax=Meloidogyne TaxID=189290 RepID=A0A915NWB6_9BILA